MVLGPLDRRALKTRCQACANRRIKCNGPAPCLYCRKKKVACIPQSIQSAEIVFVNTKPIPVPDAVPQGVPPGATDIAITRFFTVFLDRNDFAGNHFNTEAIISSFQASESLYHAILAIGSLDLRSSSSRTEQRAITANALQSYQSSISAFKSEIKCFDLRQSNAALWTTFFLGIFELMYDVTGEGWVKHILYGTSSILQFRGPEAHVTGNGRSFLLAIRLFEICRSLIYSEPSFLSEPKWLSVTNQLWHDQTDTHPKEEMFDLMLLCSALSCRVWEAVKPQTSYDESVMIDLIFQGHHLRARLEGWYERIQGQQSPSANPWLFLAIIYYHAISIYLSGIFDYRPQFDHLYPPTLALEIIQAHVTNILAKIEVALQTTNLAAICFFFPLRVAGARVWLEEQKLLILRLLGNISKRAYIVADAFILDLNTLWVMNRSREGARRAWD